MVLPVSTVVSSRPSLVSLSTVVSTSECVSCDLTPAYGKPTKHEPFADAAFFFFARATHRRLDQARCPRWSLEGNFLASFGLGWAVTTGAGLASYPLDTIRRRMMMTSGAKVHYKNMMDAGSQIIKAEGVRSLFKGAGANILRGVAGAGVLSLYDKFQELSECKDAVVWVVLFVFSSADPPGFIFSNLE